MGLIFHDRISPLHFSLFTMKPHITMQGQSIFINPSQHFFGTICFQKCEGETVVCNCHFTLVKIKALIAKYRYLHSWKSLVNLTTSKCVYLVRCEAFFLQQCHHIFFISMALCRHGHQVVWLWKNDHRVCRAWRNGHTRQGVISGQNQTDQKLFANSR